MTLRTHGIWIAGVLVIAARMGFAGEVTAPIGWIPHPFFEVTENAKDAPEFHREFYPKGESAAHWSERVVVDSRSIAAGTTPSDVLDAVHKAATAQCPDGKESRIEVHPEDAATLGLAMWHCPRNTTSRGEVAIRRVLISGSRAFVIIAQGEYAPYEGGMTPLLKVQMARWSEFQRSFALCDSWTVPGCMPNAEAIMKADVADLTAEEEKAVRQAEQRGDDMYRQDQIAWHGTDFAQEKKLLRKYRGGVFIAETDKLLSGHLYFVEQNQRDPTWVRVDVDKFGTYSEGPHESALPESIKLRLAALAFARTAQLKGCGERLNTIILPDDEGDGWLVYFLSATMKTNQVWIGGHTRVHVDHNATQILDTAYSAITCLALDLDHLAKLAHDKGDQGPVTPMTTHLVSSVPLETHVFQSLTFNRDLIVVTKHAVWRVGKGKITKLKIE